MTNAEQRESARKFINAWQGKGYEKGDTQRFWMSLLSDVLGLNNVADKIEFEKEVVVDGQTKYIDAYLPETRVLIEQKSLGKDLNKKGSQSGGIMLTPFEQAKRYANNLPVDEMPKWIVTCNFAEFHIYNMNKPGAEPEVIHLHNLQAEIYRLQFLLNEENANVNKEMEISKQASDIVGLLYDELLKQYKDPTNEQSLKSLNALCVRLVFCLYAEDAGIFGRRGMFHDYLMRFPVRDIRKALIELFQVLDTKVEDRDPYMDEELSAFPYVNGGLFADENIEIPQFTEHIRNLILTKASAGFDWSEISPTIFGAMFESTLNPETRRSGGMHYTSIENIHKVIDPLFLDDLKAEFNEIKNIPVIKTRKVKLEAFQDKLSSLKFLDPACGSGNFLTESYISLRRIENEVIKAKIEVEKGQIAGQITFGDMGSNNPIQVSIGQFYGIEINDFAVKVAMTSLWIAESQMMKETEDVVHMNLDFLPLKSYINIVEGNALRIDWETVVSKDKLNYIMGNPPFVGTKMMNKEQKFDTKNVLGSFKNYGILDYVSCWYQKSNSYIAGTKIQCAFVSTNSICQGEQVSALWKPLFEQGLFINFAYRTFRWDSEANSKAQVHCIIIGFGKSESEKKYIFIENGEKTIVSHINAYLVDAPDVFVESQRKPICDVQEMFLGCDFKDDNNYIFTESEKDEFIKKEPLSDKYIKKYINAKELISRKPRYCLWLNNADLSDIKKMPLVQNRIKSVKTFRENSDSDDTKRYAEFPMRPARLRYYSEERTTSALGLPRISSQTRRYLPMEVFDADTIGGASILMIPDATLYTFAVLSSNVHMAWMRAVCGRMKSDYRYANGIVYNTFPWPDSTDEQRIKIEKTAQGILDARALYPNNSLAELYDPVFMPIELRKAHIANDKAVMQAYGFSIKDMSEADCVAALMEMYQELTK